MFLWCSIMSLVLFFGLKGELIYLPKAVIVKHTLIKVQIKTWPSDIITFQTGERAGNGVAHLLRKRVEQLLQIFFSKQRCSSKPTK